MPSRSRSSRSRCSGVLATASRLASIAGMKVGDHEPADVVQQRGDGQLVAAVPAHGATDLVGGLLGGESVDAEALGPHLAAAVGLEEVEDRRGAGDRQHPGGLQDVDGLGNAAHRHRRRRRCGWRSAGPRSRGRRRTRPPRPPRRPERSRRSPRASPALATPSGPGTSRPPRRRQRGGRRARACRGRRCAAMPGAHLAACTLPLLCDLVDSMAETAFACLIGSKGRTV